MHLRRALLGAKKRKTTVPTTRHVLPSSQSSPIPIPHEAHPVAERNGHASPELRPAEEPTPVLASPIAAPDDDDAAIDAMPIVADVEEGESTADELHPSDANSSCLIVESINGDDGKVHLDDTLPSCSSGYESAAPLTNLDVNMTQQASSDEDDEDDDESRSRKHSSSSCQLEQPPTPILSAVSSNITLNLNTDEKTHAPALVTCASRERDKPSKYRARSRSPTPRFAKKKRSSNEPTSPTNTITSDQIEHHLRTLLPTAPEQRRTRTRPIKTPTRLVEEIAASHHPIKSIELPPQVFEPLPTSPPLTTADAIDKSFTSEPVATHPTCTYNVTISTKPNKLGFTIKKVIQR